MKLLKTTLIVFMLIFCISFAFAQQEGMDSMQQSDKGSDAAESEDMGKDMPEIMPILAKIDDSEKKVQSSQELQEKIQQRQRELEQERANLSGDKANVYKNQNEVRLAVHALLAMENLSGGIGPQVSSIAKEFNNSVQATIRDEEKIQQRSAVARLFAGGDAQAAQELEQEVNRNRERIQQLKQLKDECNCSQEVKDLFAQQIQNMETEQNRLSELAQKEQKSKGLFGWIWK